ncbi:class I SAM-dependent methyltransferase [Candidatus Gottesmanbacteria bacterium]|nr:class I SAM-dependent methyltransferase [Candidatus Gottesmanbacteria bacterium]
MIQTRCAICGSRKNFKELYKANFTEKDLRIDVFSARTIPARCHYRIVKCKNDGLVRSNPIIDVSTLNKLYKISQFAYQDETENLTETYLSALQPVLKTLSKKNAILEIGCGNGFLLKSLYTEGYHNVFGIEPSVDAVDKADKRIKKKIIVEIFKPGLFKKETFFFIFFFQTLDHIPDPEKFLKECYKLLAPGGYIMAFNHNIDSLEVKIFGAKSPIIDIVHPFFFSPKTLRMIFEKFKFNGINVYSPKNTLSLRHLIWLIPLPGFIKNRILKLDFLKKVTLKFELGNICIVGQK